MLKKMSQAKNHNKFLSCFSLISIVFFGLYSPAFSQATTKTVTETKTVTTSGTGEKESPPTKPCEGIANKNHFTKRVELYYYRNANLLIDIINKNLSPHPGCASVLPPNALQAGQGVGQGGGNIIILYGSNLYIKDTERLIAIIDLPLSGIDLQLWGLQISSKKAEKLSETMIKVRGEINLTQKLIRNLYSLLQDSLREELYNKNFDSKYQQKVIEAGYKKVFAEDRPVSLLDISLIGNSLKKPDEFYIKLAKILMELEKTEPEYKKYFEAMRSRPGSPPPFERFFRSRRLEPKCMKWSEKSKSQKMKCEIWEWISNKETDVANKTAISRRKSNLQFAKAYRDFIQNPKDFDPGQLLETADISNIQLRNLSNDFQKDIEDFFIRPTLTNIQKIVRESKGVSFAQVGRTTISTLSGVTTTINSSSTSVFQVSPQAKTLDQLLQRATTLQESVAPFVPNVGEAEVASAGPIPVSNLIGLLVAFSEQQTVPVEVETGTNLTFTPGILRDANSAELNINLTVTDPIFTSTAEEGTPKFSRIGKQEIKTSVYTRAFDFFDLSTFTNQATVDGGRVRIPVIGHLWQAIFGGIPVFGDLFSFPRGNQTVLHESLILTNSFIRPTPLSLNFYLDPDLKKEIIKENFELENFNY